MSLALAALVVVLGQSGGAGSGKVQVIKGKKSVPAQKQMKVVDAPELAPQPIVDKSKPSTDPKPAAALNEKTNGGGDQDAQPKEQSAEEKAKADKLKAQQKQIEKISADNQKLWQQSADALAGDTNN